MKKTPRHIHELKPIEVSYLCCGAGFPLLWAFLIIILFLAGCQSQKRPDVNLEVRAKVLEHFHKIYVWNKAIEEYEAGRTKVDIDFSD